MRTRITRGTVLALVAGVSSACTFLTGPEDPRIEIDYKTDRASYGIQDDVVITLANVGTGPILYAHHRFIQQWHDGQWGEGLGLWPVETAIIMEPHQLLLRRGESVTDTFGITEMGVEPGGRYRLVRRIQSVRGGKEVYVESTAFTVRE